MAIKLLLLFFLLSEVLIPKGQQIRASPQARKYFNPASQAALQ